MSQLPIAYKRYTNKKSEGEFTSYVVVVQDLTLLQNERMMELLRCYGHYHNNLRVDGKKGWIIAKHRFQKFLDAYHLIKNNL
tara:strand:+ start:2613 stop:2858 length:246 start_codon:yes stop_codon:yes gene_type:complete